MAETNSTAAAPEKAHGIRKERTGEVISNKMAKTVVVRVERRLQHAQFKKVITQYKKFYAHDESGAKPGDVVRIEETRPMSKLKRWRVVEIVVRGEEPAATIA